LINYNINILSKIILGILVNIGVWQLILIVLTIFILLFPVLALISILKNDFKGNDKIIWVLVAILLPFFGPILYFAIGRPKRLNK